MGKSLSRSATPDVSVVVPVYNKQAHLAECIESLLGQPDVALEVICVDDRSTDGSWDILTRLRRSDPRLDLIRHPSNLGPAAARNTGIERATGRYLQFTDADDLLAPHALSSLHAAAVATGSEVVRGLLMEMSDGACSLWSGAVAGEVLPESQLLPELRGVPAIRAGSLLELPEMWIPWFHTCYLVSSGLVRRAGIRYPRLSRGEDPVFLAQALTGAQRLCLTPTPSYIYRIWDHRAPAGFDAVRDYFAHADMVRHIYGSRFSTCWKAYGPYAKFDLARLVDTAELNEDQQAWAHDRLTHFDTSGIAPPRNTAAEQPAVSVIMPCRNAEQTLSRQLEALASQETAFAWELLVVDNGSTDNTVAIARRYSDRLPLRLIAAAERASRPYAYNAGAKAAIADRLIFIDADDQVAPGFLDAMQAALCEHDFVTSPLDTAYLNPAWSQHAWAVPGSAHGGDSFRLSLANGGALGISRRALEAVGGWPEDYERAVDLVLSFRVQLSGVSLSYLSSPLLRIGFRASITGLFRQARAWGYHQARAHREFGSRALKSRGVRTGLTDWRAAVRKLATARTKADLAQCALRFGFCVGRLQGSLRYRTFYL